MVVEYFPLMVAVGHGQLIVVVGQPDQSHHYLLLLVVGVVAKGPVG